MRNIFCLLVLFLTALVVGHGQTNLQFKVVSGNKLLFKEEGKLEQIFREHYSKNRRELEDRMQEAVRARMKVRSTQGLRNLNTQIGFSQYFSVEPIGENVRVIVTIPNNVVSFYVTTPDVLGIGKDRSEDPYISVKYTVIGIFGISQNGEAEAIEFVKPTWNYQIQETKFQKLENLEVGKLIEGDIPGMVWIIKELFNMLGDVKDKFNYYINEEIVENKLLQQELLIDENDKLRVSTEGDNVLLFKHDHSSAGILKRNLGTDASGITESIKTAPTVPVSTTPGDMNQKPQSTNQPSKIPTSTTPGDMNKGPAGTKKKIPKL